MRSRCTIEAALLLTLLFAGPAVAQAPVDLTVCRYLPRHKPAADVAYEPGVDVRGNQVAPADLPGSAGAMPAERFDIPVTLDFARRMGLAAPGGAALPGTAELGRLTVQGNRLLFNGQPLSGAAESDLIALCRTVR